MDFDFFVASYTHTGMTRENSEDSCLVEVGENDTAVIAVADGMGGFKASQFASSISIEFARDFFHSDSFKRLNLVNNDATVLAAIKKLFSKVNSSIMKAGESSGQKLSSTLTTGFIASRRIYVGHLGSSHAFRIRNGQIELLTIDNDKETAEILKRSNFLGSGTAYEPECFSEMVQDGDTYLFCNDNLYRALKPAEILSIIHQSRTLEDASNRLVEKAQERNQDEGITAAILRMGDKLEKPAKAKAVAAPKAVFTPKKVIEDIIPIPLKTEPPAKETAPVEDEWSEVEEKTIFSEIQKYKFTIAMVVVVLLLLAAIVLPKLLQKKEGAEKPGAPAVPVVTTSEEDRMTTEVVVVVGALKNLKVFKANDVDLIKTIKEKNKYAYTIKDKAEITCELKPEHAKSLYSIVVRFGNDRGISLKDIKTGKNKLIMNKEGVTLNLLRDFQFSTIQLPKGRTQVKIENLQSPFSLSVEGQPITIKVKRK